MPHGAIIEAAAWDMYPELGCGHVSVTPITTATGPTPLLGIEFRVDSSP